MRVFLKTDYKLENKLCFNSSLLRARDPITVQSILAGFYNNSNIKEQISCFIQFDAKWMNVPIKSSVSLINNIGIFF